MHGLARPERRYPRSPSPYRASTPSLPSPRWDQLLESASKEEGEGDEEGDGSPPPTPEVLLNQFRSLVGGGHVCHACLLGAQGAFSQFPVHAWPPADALRVVRPAALPTAGAPLPAACGAGAGAIHRAGAALHAAAARQPGQCAMQRRAGGAARGSLAGSACSAAPCAALACPGMAALVMLSAPQPCHATSRCTLMLGCTPFQKRRCTPMHGKRWLRPSRAARRRPRCTASRARRCSGRRTSKVGLARVAAPAAAPPHHAQPTAPLAELAAPIPIPPCRLDLAVQCGSSCRAICRGRRPASRARRRRRAASRRASASAARTRRARVSLLQSLLGQVLWAASTASAAARSTRTEHRLQVGCLTATSRSPRAVPCPCRASQEEGAQEGGRGCSGGGGRGGGWGGGRGGAGAAAGAVARQL